MTIPLFDCRIDISGAEVCAAVFETGRLSTGEHVVALEQQLAKRLGGRPVVLLNDMTHALEMALRLSGIGSGDDVLTLSYNCLSSTSAIQRVGATPVWVDIKLTTASIDVEDAESKITRSTRAIVVYHVAGYPADTRALRCLCEKHGLVLIEDANNAFAAILPDGKPAGTAGDYGVFSFYANRQVNAIEGAALVCADEASAARARKLRRFGIDALNFRNGDGEINQFADIDEIGFSGSISNVNAALARHSMATLDERQEIARANAMWMIEALSNLAGLATIRTVSSASPSYWVLLLLSSQRDRLLATLKAAGIACSKLHQPNHIYSGFPKSAALLPKTEEFMKSIIAVPCGWWVGPEERRLIVSSIMSVHTSSGISSI